jgi:hypothetical protein
VLVENASEVVTRARGAVLLSQLHACENKYADLQHFNAGSCHAGSSLDDVFRYGKLTQIGSGSATVSFSLV